MEKPQKVEGKEFRVQPKDIKAGQMFIGAFQHLETEVAAGYIVRFMQGRKFWSAFTYKQINDFYKRTCGIPNPGNFNFYHLLGSFTVEAKTGDFDARLDAIIREGDPENNGENIKEDDVFYVTNSFIMRCYNVAPKG